MLTYAAASANQTLTVSWTMATGSGNVTLDGAALAAGATPQVPAAPTNLTALAGNAQATLTWHASPGAASYNVYRSTSSGAEVRIQTGLTTTSFTDSGLTNSTTYFYQVSAVNSVSEGSRSNERSATPSAPATAPGAPSLNSASAGNGSVALAWSAPSDGGSAITGYKVYRGMASAGASERRAEAEGVALSHAVPEGVEAVVPYRGDATAIVAELVGGLRSAMSYLDAASVEQLAANARFVRITSAGQVESRPHDLTL